MTFDESKTVESQRHGSIRVYPISIREIKKFQGNILRAAQIAASTVKVDKDADNEQIGQAMVAALGPILLKDSFDLVGACIVFERNEGQEDETKMLSVDDLAHWDFAKVADKWLDLNFDSPEKIQPWVEMVQNGMSLLKDQSGTSLIPSADSSNS